VNVASEQSRPMKIRSGADVAKALAMGADAVAIGQGVLVALGCALGVVSAAFAMLFLAVVYGYATVVTLVTLTVEEMSFHKYSRWRDLLALVLASVLESLGLRQVSAWWRVEGLWAALRGEDWLTGEGRGASMTEVSAGHGDQALAALNDDMAPSVRLGEVAATSGDGDD